MGMTIEEAINRVQPYAHPYCACIQITGEEAQQVSEAIMVLANTSQKYQMMQADYENRLKADLKAILVELQLEIEELDSRAGYSGDGMPTFSTDYIRKKKVNELIQEKINTLEDNSHE